jgi:hypothetical protein
VLQDVAPAVFSAGIVFGIMLKLYEERPLVLKIRQSRQLKKATVVANELDKTETFLAVMTDDTSDDLRLKRYQPKRVRNQAPRAIAASPSNTVAHMASIRSYMQEHGHSRQRQS